MQHSVCVKSGTEPINTKLYSLPATQKMEMKTLIKTKEERKVICPGVVRFEWYLKKMDANGQYKFRFVADYRKLNEKRTWNAYPLSDITEIFDLLGQGKHFLCLD